MTVYAYLVIKKDECGAKTMEVFKHRDEAENYIKEWMIENKSEMSKIESNLYIRRLKVTVGEEEITMEGSEKCVCCGDDIPEGRQICFRCQGKSYPADDFTQNVIKLPPDIQPVKHGRWEETHISLCKDIPEDEKEEGHSFYIAEMKCSCCNRYNAVIFGLTLDKPNFCQLCGAIMDGGEKNE